MTRPQMTRWMARWKAERVASDFVDRIVWPKGQTVGECLAAAALLRKAVVAGYLTDTRSEYAEGVRRQLPPGSDAAEAERAIGALLKAWDYGHQRAFRSMS